MRLLLTRGEHAVVEVPRFRNKESSTVMPFSVSSPVLFTVIV